LYREGDIIVSVVPSPAIRRAEAADVEVVQQINADAYVPAHQNVIGAVPKPAFEDYAPRIERGEAWVLEVDGKPVGVAILEEKPDHLLVYSIAVTPDEQRKGHGRALLRFADQRAVAIGVREVRLYTNRRMTRNVTLYRRCGFVEVGTRPHPSRAGEMLVDMVRPLMPDPSV
jgi:ribosomal protein S18 acetylase RimI-like enzyme